MNNIDKLTVADMSVLHICFWEEFRLRFLSWLQLWSLCW